MSAVAEPLRERNPARPLERGRGLWGMRLFIVTEAMLFALLFFAYFFLGASNENWPPVEDPAYMMAMILAGILLASSLTAAWGEAGIKKGNATRLNIGIAITLLLGVVFLVIQILEYRIHLASLRPTESAYGSIFYTITSLHFAHLVLGFLMLAFLFVRGLAGHFSGERHLAVTTTVLYWHFVDGMWIFIIAVLYLSPHFYGP